LLSYFILILFSLLQKLESVPVNLDRLFIVFPETRIDCLNFHLLFPTFNIVYVLELAHLG
jgi:hypothetical protein